MRKIQGANGKADVSILDGEFNPAQAEQIDSTMSSAARTPGKQADH